MPELTTEALIRKAESVVNPKKVGDFMIGDVGCALLTDKGNLYLGVCIDAASGVGFCAEHSAIAAMITAGEYSIKTIVAVWRNETDVYILSPCGRCRELMRQINPDNVFNTDVILDTDHIVKLVDIFPYHDHFHKTMPRAIRRDE